MWEGNKNKVTWMIIFQDEIYVLHLQIMLHSLHHVACLLAICTYVSMLSTHQISLPAPLRIFVLDQGLVQNSSSTPIYQII